MKFSVKPVDDSKSDARDEEVRPVPVIITSETKRMDDGGISGPSSLRRNSLLHSNLEDFANGTSSANEISPLQVVGNARRRLSNVGDAVSRKISNTIGWRTGSPSVELTVSQGTSLCGEYIRDRLKRAGVQERRAGLRRTLSSMLLPGSVVVTEVSPVLNAVGAELEKMHPNTYERVGRQMGSRVFPNEQSVYLAMVNIATEIFRAENMTWGKVVSIYAVAGGLALDCVRQNKPDYLPAIQRGMTQVLESCLAVWIQTNGGWITLATRYRPIPEETPWVKIITIVPIVLMSFAFLLTMYTYFTMKK